MSDYYFMSTNAITYEGELVNIDGNGNRVACLIHGPRHVIIIAGMNKVATTLEGAFERARTMACPPNAVRLDKKTPCAATGKCGDCLSPDCFCNFLNFTVKAPAGKKDNIEESGAALTEAVPDSSSIR